MRRPPPITHAIHRAVTRRPCGLGFTYTARCDCGTTWPPTPDRDAREAAIRKHLDGMRRAEIAQAEAAKEAAEKRVVEEAPTDA